MGKTQQAVRHVFLARKLDLMGRLSLTRESAPAGGGRVGEWKPSPAFEERRSRALNGKEEFVVAPIFSTAGVSPREDDVRALQQMKERLRGDGNGVRIGFSEVYGYMTETLGARGDYRIDLGRLKYILSLSVELEMPVLVHLNGGNWCDYLNSHSRRAGCHIYPGSQVYSSVLLGTQSQRRLFSGT